jgi:hypothetical protein
MNTFSVSVHLVQEVCKVVLLSFDRFVIDKNGLAEEVYDNQLFIRHIVHYIRRQ